MVAPVQDYLHSQSLCLKMSTELVDINGEMKSLTIVPIEGDGACLFRALSYLIHGTQERAMDIRKKIVDHVTSNWDEFAVFTHDTDGDNYKTKEEYESEMLLHNTYGSFCELRAASEIFPFVFELYRHRKLLNTLGREGHIKRLRFSGDLSEGHFDAYADTVNNDDEIPVIEELRPSTECEQSQPSTQNQQSSSDKDSNVEEDLPFRSVQRFEYWRFCSLCRQVFSTINDATKHRRQQHAKYYRQTIVFTCYAEVRVPTNKSSIDNWDFKNGFPFQKCYRCVVCNKVLVSREEKIRHIANAHSSHDTEVLEIYVLSVALKEKNNDQEATNENTMNKGDNGSNQYSNNVNELRAKVAIIEKIADELCINDESLNESQKNMTRSSSEQEKKYSENAKKRSNTSRSNDDRKLKQKPSKNNEIHTSAIDGMTEHSNKNINNNLNDMEQITTNSHALISAEKRVQAQNNDIIMEHELRRLFEKGETIPIIHVAKLLANRAPAKGQTKEVIEENNTSSNISLALRKNAPEKQINVTIGTSGGNSNIQDYENTLHEAPEHGTYENNPTDIDINQNITEDSNEVNNERADEESVKNISFHDKDTLLEVVQPNETSKADEMQTQAKGIKTKIRELIEVIDDDDSSINGIDIIEISDEE